MPHFCTGAGGTGIEVCTVAGTRPTRTISNTPPGNRSMRPSEAIYAMLCSDELSRKYECDGMLTLVSRVPVAACLPLVEGADGPASCSAVPRLSKSGGCQTLFTTALAQTWQSGRIQADPQAQGLVGSGKTAVSFARSLYTFARTVSSPLLLFKTAEPCFLFFVFFLCFLQEILVLQNQAQLKTNPTVRPCTSAVQRWQ